MFASPPAQVPFLLCTGPILIDELHFLPDRTVCFQPGGNAVIFAAVAARFGVHTAIAGLVGDDKHGDSIRAVLDSSGVDTSSLGTNSGGVTKVAQNLVHPDGTWEYKSSCPRLGQYLHSACSVNEASPYTHVHIAGLNAMLRANIRETRDLIRSCRTCGLPVSLGLSRFTGQEHAALRKVASPSDLVLCNREEFSQLLGSPLDGQGDVVHIVKASQWHSVAVTLGPHGALIKWNRRECYHVKPPKTKVKNTLGAGDIFSAVLLSALLSGYAIEQAARFACAAGSLSVQRETWMSWMSTKSDVVAMLAEHADTCSIEAMSIGSV